MTIDRTLAPESAMTATSPVESSTLYDRDYLLWLTTTAEQLRRGRFTDLDVENLIEEIESIGKSQKNAIESLLIVLLVHLLKLAYWESERERNLGHWSEEITAFRDQIASLLATSPSLKPYIREIFARCYEKARVRVARSMEVKLKSLPSTPIATLEQTLDDNWFPIPLDFNE
ncbi:DUF29 domain-containing protein [Pannus brasiliensis CCIBt3594]|uniref:DUF29 domain-containing protein n=1 Tax=Pannus brasiliensis CCIBt3594 TaxID=1427578 RepID=A0AAW9QMD4_9CHRO